MVQRWDHLTFLHWPYEPDTVQALLPPSLRVDVTEGAAWVSLVPFQLTVALPGVRPVPWVSRFLETNVRTYVLDEEGTAGVWFFSLDAARLGAVLTARATYRLPYHWAAMSMQRDADRVHYRCRRRWPNGGPISSVAVEVGEPYRPDELTEMDRWLTARWRVFSSAGGSHRHTRAWHPPSPLHRARVLQIDDHLVVAAGLPPVTVPPLVQYSPGVPVRIGARRGHGAAPMTAHGPWRYSPGDHSGGRARPWDNWGRRSGTHYPFSTDTGRLRLVQRPFGEDEHERARADRKRPRHAQRATGLWRALRARRADPDPGGQGAGRRRRG